MSYSTEGFKEIYEAVRDPALRKLIADEIEASPKRAIEHVFKTTEKQKRAIDKKTDDELRKMALPLLKALRSNAPEEITFHPSVDSAGVIAPKRRVGECFQTK